MGLNAVTLEQLVPASRPLPAVDELVAGLPTEAYTTDPEVCARYGADRWPIASKRELLGERVPHPALVVRPSNAEEIAKVLRRAQACGVAVTPYGAGSSVVGGAIPADGGILIDLRRMDRVLEFDEVSLLVTAEAGIKGDVLERWLNERGYTLGHFPQSLHLSTLGGWVATRASGTFSSRYGNIEDIVDGLRVVLPDGELIDIAPCPRRSAGPELTDVFIGSEGTLGIVTEVDVRVRPVPAVRRFAGFRFAELGAAIATIRELAQLDRAPALVRLYDAEEAQRLLEAVGEAAGTPLLVLGWDGDEETVSGQETQAGAICARHGGAGLGSAVGEAWFESRFDVAPLIAAIERRNGLADTIEISMRWRDAEQVYQAATTAADRHASRVLAHFSHVYPSGTSLYVIFTVEAESDAAAEQAYLRVWEDVTTAAMAAGASLSHHHGVGVARARWMAQEHGAGLRVLQAIKGALDPAGILNPGKLLPLGEQR
ncbi:hypothetical protein DSM104299_03615 [Baekduia alba]|uniref:FAD-binding oxidoreductase n=1 Tax=Baekduia alba TaxID=2997333 RepID=UPI0023424DC7|nr:FAD-binding oxidoreductase [Baekduia alba]WCB94875.1 hypothetical protein DSM104299_03615 [Baekduia alba]